MASTTNYNWTTPDDTGLVKDGASAIRSLGTSIDTTTKNLNPSTTLGDLEYRSSTSNTNTRLGIGTSGQGLQVVAGVPAWAASSTSTLTTTGDLLYASAANTLARRGIGTTGQVLTVSGGVPTWANASTGLTWTLRHKITAGYFISVAYNGSNLYVAGGSSGVMATSSDGITWTNRTSGFGSNNILRIIWANSLSLWVAVGSNGTITTSPDGITWTARTANMGTNTIRDIIANGSTLVAVGNGGGATNTGGITYSTDGTTWTRKSQTPTIGAIYYGVVFNGTNYIVVANSSTNNYLYASTPSGTWTAGAFVSGADLNFIFWDGTRHIVGQDASTNVYYTTSTTLSTSATLYSDGKGTSGDKSNNTYYNSRFYSAYNYLWDYSTTPFGAGTLDYPESISALTLFPSGVSPSQNAGYGYFVGAPGRIICNSSGALYTSF